MNDSGHTAVALRDAHFRLKRLARAWAEATPAGTVRGREPLGPAWQYSDRPDEACYLDGQALELAGGLTVIAQLTVGFAATGIDMLAAVTVEDDEGNVTELLSTGPEEFPTTATELATEIDRCLTRMEGLDLAPTLR